MLQNLQNSTIRQYRTQFGQGGSENVINSEGALDLSKEANFKSRSRLIAQLNYK